MQINSYDIFIFFYKIDMQTINMTCNIIFRDPSLYNIYYIYNFEILSEKIVLPDNKVLPTAKPFANSLNCYK